MKEHSEKKQLVRNLTFLDGMIYVVGFVIGTGVFLKPSIIIVNVGSTMGGLMVWIGGGLISLCCALTIAEIASNIPKTGGLYSFLVDLYGDLTGFLFGWIEVIISSPGSSAALALATATFAGHFLPLTPWQLKLVALGFLLLVTGFQILSVKGSIRIQGIATIGKLVPIAGVILFGILFGKEHSLSMAPVVSHTTVAGGIGVALLGAMWAYDGWIHTCTLGKEMVNPEKNLPRSIIFGLSIVIIIYALFNLGIINSMTADEIANSGNIGVDVSLKLFGSIGTDFLAMGMLLSCYAALNAQMIAGIRLTFAMAEEKQLPKYRILSKLNERYSTPIYASLFQVAIACVFILVGTFDTITDLCIFMIWIFFTLGVLGIFRLRKLMPLVTREPGTYKVPLYPVIPLLGAAGGAFMLISSLQGDGLWRALLGIGLTLTGVPVYYWVKKGR